MLILTLSADNDSDGDGVDDLTEGVGDDDVMECQIIWTA